ncbi:unnamed protein product [Closterium sp. Yama58-4]|nr:unnamed protein product [Closterium sp. Yama58-4]
MLHLSPASLHRLIPHSQRTILNLAIAVTIVLLLVVPHTVAVKRAPAKKAPSRADLLNRELLTALKDLDKKNPFFSVFAQRFYTAARVKLISLEGPATILVPSNVGNQFMKMTWEAFTPQQRLRIMKNLIIKGKFSKDRLLSTVPLWQFPTMNMGLKLVKMNSYSTRECYFKAVGGSAFGPLNMANLSITRNIQVHGISTVPIPANA